MKVILNAAKDKVGFRATLNFRKFKLAMNPTYRMFSNFAEICALLCISNVDDKKNLPCRL